MFDAPTELPLVSIIVPTFNRAWCIARCIDSALAQTHGNLEIILVDDGSTDATPALIQSRYGHDDRVRYFRQDNAGVTIARNTGLAQARGDFIALLDSDDVWKPWKLAAQLACFAAFPQAGMVWTDMEAVGPTGDVTHAKYLRTMYSCWRRYTADQLFPRTQSMPPAGPMLSSTKVYVGDIFAPMFFGSLVHTSTVMLSRARFEIVGGFDPKLARTGEDYDFHLRTCEAGPVAFLDVASIQYQTGMPDRLTDRKYRMQGAANTLATIQSARDRAADRITLPPAAIRRRFAEVHARLGEALLDEGQRNEARRHLAKSLRLHPRPGRTARLLAMACLPVAVGQAVRSMFRAIKRLSPRTAISGGTA